MYSCDQQVDFQLDKAIVILGTCLPDQIFKGCYEIGELTSCCCAPATPKITAPETTIKAPSNIQCPDCTPTSNDCYLTDPFIPSLGYCLAGYDFYGCYDKNGDITKCCCKPNIQTDCTISGLRS